MLADKINCAISTGACNVEQIIASDRTGVHVVDQSIEYQPQTGPQLTGLTLHNDTVRWDDQGVPKTAELAP